MALRDEMISWNLNYDDLEIEIGCCTTFLPYAQHYVNTPKCY